MIKWLLILAAIGAVGSLGYLLLEAHQDIGKLETTLKVKEATIKAKQEELNRIFKFNERLDELELSFDRQIEESQAKLDRISRGIKDVKESSEKTKELLNTQLTADIIRLLCDGNYFTTTVAKEVCRQGTASEVPSEVQGQ